MIRHRSIAIAVGLVSAVAIVAAERQVFRAGVDGVAVDVSVTLRNRPVEGLTAADFELTDNGVPQRILDVSRESIPIDVTFVADLSGGGVLQTSVVAGVNKVREHLRDDDRVRIVTFRSSAREVSALAGARSILPLSLPPGRVDWLRTSGGAACYDALTLALVTPAIAQRRQLAILFSTGRDTSSFLDRATALEVARRSRTAVFVVDARLDFTPREPPREGATARAVPVDPLAIPAPFFKALTEATGGTVQIVEAFNISRADSMGFAVIAKISYEGIEGAFLRALDAFRSSYVLRYVPEGIQPKGWHDLTVRVIRPGEGYEVRARKGYVGDDGR